MHTGIICTARTFFGRPYTVYPTEHLHPHYFHNIQQQITTTPKHIANCFTNYCPQCTHNFFTRCTLAQLRTNKSPKSCLHQVDAKSHPSPLCPLCNTHIEVKLGTTNQMLSLIRRSFTCCAADSYSIVYSICAPKPRVLGLQSGEASSREDSCMSSRKYR